jgi:CDP-glucose 4,6-dehydratase
MVPDFWRSRRVLVTGHTGFKGGWLCTWLKSLGAVVTGYALPAATTPSLFEAASVPEGMNSVLGDVRDATFLRSVLEQADPEIIFHMAAQPLVRASYADPADTYSTNVMGTVNLLDAARHLGSVRAIVNVTSDKCYENREWVWGYRETESMGGYDPYSASKGCAELVTASFRRSFGLPLASVRAGNVIGGGDWSTDRLVPDILRSFEGGQPPQIRNPDAIRPWQHVVEPLRGYLSVAERVFAEPQVFAEAWNFGPRDEDCQPVSRVLDGLAAAWGHGVGWVSQPGNHPHEAGYLRLDSSKARSRLGWCPKTDLSVALDLTVAWHRAWMAGQDMYSFTLKQIENHG